MFGQWDILDWHHDAFAAFETLRKKRLKMSTSGLKIASIVLAHDATLLTRNLHDFTKVPGLRIKDWLD